MVKNKKITVEGTAITNLNSEVEDFISLTDIARHQDSQQTDTIVQNWMRTRSAIEFCGLWEQLNNPDFKRIEFDAFRKMPSYNKFSPTSAIGMNKDAVKNDDSQDWFKNLKKIFYEI
jgi:hypothetical protein